MNFQNVFAYSIMVILALVSINNVTAQGRKAPDWFSNYEPNTHKNMPYRLMKPLNFDPKKSYPVIVSLHGAGGKGSDNRKQMKSWNKELAEKNAALITPAMSLSHKARNFGAKEN